MADNSYEEITIQVDSSEAEASLENLIKSFRVMESLAENIGTSVTKAFVSLKKSMENTEKGIGTLTQELTKATTVMQNLAQTDFLNVFWTIIDAGTLVADLVINANVLSTVFSKLSGLLTTFGGWITRIFSAIGGWLINTLIPLVSGAVAACGGWLVAIIAAVVAVIVAVVVCWDEIKLFFTDTLPQLWSQFVEWVSGIGAAAAELFSSAMSAISGFFTDCWNGIVEIWSGIGEWMQSNVIQPIINFFTPIVQWFAELFGSIWQTVLDMFLLQIKNRERVIRWGWNVGTGFSPVAVSFAGWGYNT